MLRSLLPISFALVATNAFAQVPTDPAVLRSRLADKHAAAFLHAPGVRWHTDLESAKLDASRQGKLVLVHFTRSFIPCGMSIGCERDVLSAPEFQSLAERVVLFCHVTAHVSTEDDQLLFDCGGSGWPHHAVLDATGRVLGKHPSHEDKSVDALASLVGRAEEYLAVEAECAAVIEGARRKQLLAGLELGSLSLADARKLLAGAGSFSAEKLAWIGTRLADLEVAEIVGRYDRFDDSTHAAVGKELYGMWRMGKRPGSRNAARDFWAGILSYQESQEEPRLDLYREALGELEKRFGESRGYRRYLDARRAFLAKHAPDAGPEAVTERVTAGGR